MPVQIGAKSSAFSDPTGLMSDCHRRIEMFMRALTVAAGFKGRKLKEEERRALDAALRYFREAAPKHNADEEESLFPRLRSLGQPEVQNVLAHIDRLEQEHRWASPLHLKVDRLGQQWIANGEIGRSEADAFQSAVSELRAMYRTHIEFEDSVLFPLVRRVLSAVQAAEIGGEMAKRRNLTEATRVSSQNGWQDILRRDPEDGDINQHDWREAREKMLDKTIADSFPASDPPSSDPAPEADPTAV